MVDASSGNSRGKVILGLSAYYHDAAACLVIDGIIIAAAHEERFTRKKHDSSFPLHAVEFCLEFAGLKSEEVDQIVFYDKPFLKFERLIETYLFYAPRGLRSFLSSVTVWVKEKIFLRRQLVAGLVKVGFSKDCYQKLLFVEHHLSHAASAFYPSSFEEAAILTVDGVGELATASISHGRGANIEIKKELYFPHSVGLLYSAFTYFLGFRVNSGEYKLMGLAPYGNHGSERVERFKKIIRETLVDIKSDGSIFLNQSYFSYATGLRMVDDAKWQKLFGFARRGEDDIRQEHCDLALAIQQVTEEIVVAMARHAKEITGARYLCLAGGVALNCVANSKILLAGIFDDVWIQPAAGDAGGALGAALAIHYLYFHSSRQVTSTDQMQGAYLGPEFTEADTRPLIKKYRAHFVRYDSETELCRTTAQLVAQGSIVGWFQGRMEWGPRALGNRSIIADPRNKEAQKTLNLKIKFREGFRPFAPSVMYEEMKSLFDFDRPSPYMLFVAPVVTSRRLPLPENVSSLSWQDKLYHLRSDIPSVTHLDYSARLQTVHKESNPRYWNLINEFKNVTGYGVVVNTSFNVRGEPIVCTPEDAYNCFMYTEMDYLVIGNLVFDKKMQRPLTEYKQWANHHVHD